MKTTCKECGAWIEGVGPWPQLLAEGMCPACAEKCIARLKQQLKSGYDFDRAGWDAASQERLAHGETKAQLAQAQERIAKLEAQVKQFLDAQTPDASGHFRCEDCGHLRGAGGGGGA